MILLAPRNSDHPLKKNETLRNFTETKKQKTIHKYHKDWKDWIDFGVSEKEKKKEKKTDELNWKKKMKKDVLNLFRSEDSWHQNLDNTVLKLQDSILRHVFPFFMDMNLDISLQKGGQDGMKTIQGGDVDIEFKKLIKYCYFDLKKMIETPDVYIDEIDDFEYKDKSFKEFFQQNDNGMKIREKEKHRNEIKTYLKNNKTNINLLIKDIFVIIINKPNNYSEQPLIEIFFIKNSNILQKIKIIIQPQYNTGDDDKIERDINTVIFQIDPENPDKEDIEDIKEPFEKLIQTFYLFLKSQIPEIEANKIRLFVKLFVNRFYDGKVLDENIEGEFSKLIHDFLIVESNKKSFNELLKKIDNPYNINQKIIDLRKTIFTKTDEINDAYLNQLIQTFETNRVKKIAEEKEEKERPEKEKEVLKENLDEIENMLDENDNENDENDNDRVIVKEFEVTNDGPFENKTVKVNKHIDYYKKVNHDLYNLLNQGMESQKEVTNVVDPKEYFEEDVMDQTIDEEFDEEEEDESKWKLNVPENIRDGYSDVLRSTIRVNPKIATGDIDEIFYKNKRNLVEKTGISSYERIPYYNEVVDESENKKCMEPAIAILKYCLIKKKIEVELETQRVWIEHVKEFVSIFNKCVKKDDEKGLLKTIGNFLNYKKNSKISPETTRNVYSRDETTSDASSSDETISDESNEHDPINTLASRTETTSDVLIEHDPNNTLDNSSETTSDILIESSLTNTASTINSVQSNSVKNEYYFEILKKKIGVLQKRYQDFVKILPPLKKKMSSDKKKNIKEVAAILTLIAKTIFIKAPVAIGAVLWYLIKEIFNGKNYEFLFKTLYGKNNSIEVKELTEIVENLNNNDNVSDNDAVAANEANNVVADDEPLELDLNNINDNVSDNDEFNAPDDNNLKSSNEEIIPDNKNPNNENPDNENPVNENLVDPVDPLDINEIKAEVSNYGLWNRTIEGIRSGVTNISNNTEISSQDKINDIFNLLKNNGDYKNILSELKIKMK